MGKDCLIVRLFDLPDDLRVRLPKSFKVKYRLQVRRQYGPGKGIYRFFCTMKGHNGSGGPTKPPTISIGQLKDAVKKIGISQGEIEANVISIVTKGSGVEGFVKFPLTPTEDHAWIMGLFYSSGGLRLRSRDRNVRVIADPGVDQQVLAIGCRIGNVPHIYHNAKARLNGKTWSRKRLPLDFNRVMFDIFMRLGLEKHQPIQRGSGRYTAAREHQSEIPQWIVSDNKMMHDFVEGYINGIRGQSWMYPQKRINTEDSYDLVSGVHVRFVGLKVEKYSNQIISYLNSIGITGIMIHQRRKNRTLQHYNYDIFSKKNIRKFLAAFKVYKADLRVRCNLMVNADPVLHKILQCLDSTDIVCLGLIIEKPMRTEELWSVLRWSKLQQSVKRLLERKVLVEKNGILRYEPKVLQEQLRDKYLGKLAKNLEERQKYLGLYPFKCSSCHRTSLQKICEHCGAKTEPVSRASVIKPLVRSGVAFMREEKKLR